MKPTKEEMIEKIYEVIAEKKITIKYVLYCPECWGKTKTNSYHTTLNKNVCRCKKCNWITTEKTRETYTYIPVMIWDCLEWIENTHNESNDKWEDNIHSLIFFRTEYRKPIESQNIECIEFIYSLIQEND